MRNATHSFNIELCEKAFNNSNKQFNNLIHKLPRKVEAQIDFRKQASTNSILIAQEYIGEAEEVLFNQLYVIEQAIRSNGWILVLSLIPEL